MIMDNLLNKDFFPVNIGIEKFAQDLNEAGYRVMEKDWKPPYSGDPALAQMLADMADDDRGLGLRIKQANQQAVSRLLEAQPVLREIAPARDVLKDMHSHKILHAGPPVAWDQMCGPMQGSIVGGILYERLAETPEQAFELAGSGAFEFAPCHSLDAVGPMAGIITPRMPLMVIENTKHGTRAYASMNEGWGRTLRFGAYDPDVIARLDWMEQDLARLLNLALKQYPDGLDVKSMIARAVHMGDECHNRDIAASSLFFKEIAPVLVSISTDSAALNKVLQFLSQQEHFFLNIAMASCKASLLAAANIPFSSMVTAIGRNGVHVGIQVSGAGKKWFTAVGKVPQGLYFPGYSEADANPDLGDSAITETGGLGAFAMAGAPAIVRFVGGSPEDAIRFTQEMYSITLGENPGFTMPPLGFRGTPSGIDVRAVVQTSIAPVINTGIAHKQAGHGLVGAGVVRAPLEVFEQAARYLHAQWTANEGRDRDD
jgi:hypothetical protein